MLNQLPTYRDAYTRILLSRKRGGVIPRLEAEVESVRVDAAQLTAFREVAAHPDTGRMPTTYPHVMVGSLHGHLIADQRFPHPALGLVHVANRIRVFEPMGLNDVWRVRVFIEGQRDVARGIEFDLVTEFRQGERLVWDQTTTVLRSVKSENASKAPKTKKSSTALAPPHQPLRSVVLAVPEHIGRAYAAVSGDYNPIHLHALAARAFGFPRAIATGMWTVARVVAEIASDLPEAGYQLDVAFKRPVFLPSRVVFSSYKDASTPEALTWDVRSPDNQILHMTGAVQRL